MSININLGVRATPSHLLLACISRAEYLVSSLYNFLSRLRISAPKALAPYLSCTAESLFAFGEEERCARVLHHRCIHKCCFLAPLVHSCTFGARLHLRLRRTRFGASPRAPKVRRRRRRDAKHRISCAEGASARRRTASIAPPFVFGDAQHTRLKKVSERNFLKCKC